jgi:hypothetical protein
LFCTCFQSLGHVESEIAKWQKGIDQSEQRWLRKLQHTGSVESAATGKLQHNGSAEAATATGKHLTAQAGKKQLISQIQNRGSSEQESKPSRSNIQAAGSKAIEGVEWSNSSYKTLSGCSSASSDLELDSDVPVVLPSVKQLAKHFSGSAASNSDSSATKVIVR